MGYLVIKGEETHYNVTLQPFTTQHGYRAFRFIGDTVPKTNKGFLFFSDAGSVISDLSDFTHFYGPNEYSMEADQIVMPKGTDVPNPPSDLDKLSSRVSRVSARVSQTEYKEDNLEQSVADLEDSLCEYSVEIEQSLADIEDSLCELSELEEEE